MTTGTRLKDKVIIVTGGANGLGRVYCNHMAEEGAKLVIVDLDIKAGRELEAELNEKNKNSALALEVDVTSEEATMKMGADAHAHFGRIDVLVNNAGVYPHQDFDTITYASWKKVMSINLDSVFLCTKAILHIMKSQNSGKIINVATNLVWVGLPSMVHYVASKAGIIGFTRSLAREVGDYNITVNGITPGAVVKEADYDLVSLKRLERIVEHQSMKWCQRPIDLVGPMLFLCSSDSDFISGQFINVDGGLTNH